MACGQRSRGEAIELPARTASFRQWAGWLAERAEALWQPESSETWLAQARRRSKDSLPVDGERLDEGPADTVSVWLSVEETQSLLSDALRAYRTEVNDGLLTALAQTFAAWTGEPALLVDLERSAREGAFEGLDLSRTVGCLAIVAPVLLHLGGAHSPGESLKAVKEQVRRLPEWGIGYGLLRYLSPDGETATRMRDLPQAEVIFRGPDLPGGTVPVPSLFAPTPSPAMARLARGLRVVPPYRLEVDCEIVAGRLRAVWTYGRQVYRRSTIEALAQGFAAALRSLLEHCLDPGTVGYTPSDFPRVEIGQRELDGLVASRRGEAGRDLLEDIYPLTPLQQGMLFHILEAPGSGLYLNQQRFTLQGDLDVPAFRGAFQRVVDRHQALRTAVVLGVRSEPLQVVCRRARLPWTYLDWRELSPAERLQRLEALLGADRERGFELSQ